MIGMERRLATLERTISTGATVFIWAELDDTAADAIDRRGPNGVPTGARVVVFSWADRADAGRP